MALLNVCIPPAKHPEQNTADCESCRNGKANEQKCTGGKWVPLIRQSCGEFAADGCRLKIPCIRDNSGEAANVSGIRGYGTALLLLFYYKIGYSLSYGMFSRRGYSLLCPPYRQIAPMEFSSALKTETTAHLFGLPF